jgi:hypothetical protein
MTVLLLKKVGDPQKGSILPEKKFEIKPVPFVPIVLGAIR